MLMTPSTLHLHPHRMSIGPGGVQPFAWPVAIETTVAARDHFVRATMAYLRAENVDKSENAEALWLALPHLISDFCYVHQCAAAGKALADAKWRVEYGEVALIAEGAPIGISPRIEFARLLPRAQPAWRLPLRLIKMLLSSGPVVSKPYFAVDPDHDVVIFQAPLHLLNQAKAENIRRLVLSRFDAWMGAANPAEDARQTGMSAATRAAYRAILVDSFRVGGIDLQDQIADVLQDSAEIIVRRVQTQTGYLRRREKWLPKRFWSGSGGNLMNRVFGRMVSRNGGQVTAFDHGMSTGLWDCWDQTVLEFNWADRFITFSETMARGLRHNYVEDYIGRSNHRCEIIAAANHGIEPAQQEVTRQSAGRQVKYVPTLYAGRSTQITPLLPDIVAVDWQARLLSFLREEGWDVSMKPHPESYCLPPPAFSQFGVRIDGGMFEDLPDLGATMIFDYPQSTAFRSALMGRQPIILIDLPRLRLQQGVLDLLANRCAIVRGRFDKDNRVQIDWNDLRQALVRAPDLIDDKSVRECLFPVSTDMNEG
ncbi:MAG: hypothetical protein VW600_02525 [Ferrovibrio sp.]